MEDDDIFADDEENETEESLDNDNKTEAVTDKKPKKPLDKKTKLILAGVGAGVAVVIIICLLYTSDAADD